MLRIAVILSVLATLAQAGEIEWKMMQKIHKWNLYSRCWGDEAMGAFAVKMQKAMDFCSEVQSPIFGGNSAFPLPAPIDNNQLEALRGLLSNPNLAALLKGNQANAWQNGFGRKKRALLEPTSEDEMEFMEDVMDFKAGMSTTIGNMSCVLTQMEMLDGAGNINMQSYSLAGLGPLLKNTPAGSDPAFMERLTTGFSDCYEISRAWPQKSLDRNPMTMKYGRHKIFFKCAKKVEDHCCTQFQMKQWVESFYGPLTDEKIQRFGLPTDKYDAATFALKVMHKAMTPEQKKVDDFFWQFSKM
jgi:hypothetical protein